MPHKYEPRKIIISRMQICSLQATIRARNVGNCANILNETELDALTKLLTTASHVKHISSLALNPADCSRYLCCGFFD